MPSRRAMLAVGGVLFAGCASSPGTRTNPTADDTATSTAPPTTTEGSSTTDGTTTDDEPDGGDRDPPTGDAVAWTLDVGRPVASAPVLDGDSGLLALAIGEFDRGDPPSGAGENTAARDVVAASTDGDERWRYEASADVTDLVATDSGVYASIGWPTWPEGTDFHVERLSNGEREWTAGDDWKDVNLVGSPADGGVVGGTHDDGLDVKGETLFAYGSGGEERWTVESGDVLRGSVHDRRVYLSYADRLTRCVDVASGETRWEADGGVASGYDDPVVYDGSAYVEAAEANADGDYPLVALDAADGTERWRYATDTGDDSNFVPTNAVEIDGVVYVVEYGGTIAALDAADGSERWVRAFETQIRDGPEPAGEFPIVTTEGGRVHALDPETGETAWRDEHDQEPSDLYAHGGGVTVQARTDDRSTVVRYDLDGTRTWSFEHEGRSTGLAVDGETAFLATLAGFLVALEA